MRALGKGVAAFAFSVAIAAGGTASAAMMEMEIALEGSQEVPPVETSATGQVQVDYDSDKRMLTWELEYDNLSSDATAAHFHGPAEPGENAPPVVPLEDFSNGAEGSAELTEEQAAMLMDGKMYFNLHSANHPAGELRGQVTMDGM